MTSQSGLPVVPVPACPVCGEGGGGVRHESTRDRWFGVGGSWAYRECGSCAGLWLDPRPSTESLHLVYSGYYTHREGEAAPARNSRWRGIRGHLPWHGWDRAGEVGYLDGLSPGKVLDVGCGNGARLARLAVTGWSGAGVDLDRRAVEAARRATGGDIVVGTIYDVGEPGEFDAIVMFHVLEHVEAPLDTLARARTLLGPAGVLSIVTPNARSWLHSVYGHRWRGLEPPRHLQVFSGAGLRLLLHQAGFGQIHLKTTERNAGPIAVASSGAPETGSQLKKVLRMAKSEAVQAVEWARLHRWPLSGEELVGTAMSDRSCSTV